MSNMNWGKFGVTLGGYVLGMVIGTLLGQPMLGAALGGVIGGVVGNLVFPDPTTKIHTEGPRLQNFVTTSSYGWPIPILFGHDRLSGCVIWASDPHEHSQTETAEEGGKGGGGGGVEQSYTSYYYTQSFAVKICRGPVAKLFRIWADNKLIYDCKPENDGPIIGRKLKFNFYEGTEDQGPDPTIESYKGVGNTPAYRGDCYIVFRDMNITDYGGRIPNLNFEVATVSEDAYPEVALDVTGLLGSSAILRKGHDGEYAVLYRENKFLVVDIISNRVLASRDFEAMSPDFGAIDMSGQIHTVLQDEQYAFHPICIDRDLNIVREGDVIYDRRFFDSATSPGNLYFFLACYDPVGIFRQDYEVRLLNKNTFQELWRWEDLVIEDWGTGSRICGICIDNYYNCWALIEYTDQYQEDGRTWLVRLTPFYDDPTWYTLTTMGTDPHPTAIGYDPSTGYILLSDPTAAGVHTSVWVWDPVNETLVKQFGPASNDGHDYHAHRDDLRNTVNNLLWCGRDDSQYVAINLNTLEVVREYDRSNWGPYTPDEHILYDPVCNALWPELMDANNEIFYKYPLDRGERSTVLLASDIIQVICEEVGLTTDDLNLTEIATDEVRGYLIDQQMSARKAIEPLQQAFFWDCAEIDGKITAVKRGGASVVTIPEADLAVAEEGQERPDELPITRTQELELPRVLNVQYVDIDQSYQPGTQRSIRQTTDSVGEATITLPMVLTATEAKRIAEVLHQIAWLERNRYAPVFIPPKYLYVTVTDVITVERGGNTYLLHLQKIDQGANYLMKVEAIPEDAARYNSYAIGESGEHIPQQTIDYPGATEPFLLDTPHIRDNEEYSSPYGFYAAVCGRLAAWRGATLYRSLDEGVSFQGLRTMLNGAVAGVASDALGEPGDPWTWDYHNVTIRLLRETDELENCSKLNALNGQNAFLLGHPNKGWELCAFCEATLNEDGSYTLGTLLRALRGTEWMIDQHGAGDIFILLSTSTIYRIDGQAADLDQERLYGVVSLGMPFSSGTLMTFANTGRGLMPYAPCHIRGSRDGSNNLTATWIRRTRVDGEWRDKVDVPLGEASEGYEVDIIKDGSVVRTFEDLTTPEVTYPAAQQTADGFTPGDPIPVEVFQMSEAVGRGFAGEATV